MVSSSCFLMVFPWCCYPRGEIETWTREVHWTLRYSCLHSSVSRDLRQALLLERDQDVFEDDEEDFEEEGTGDDTTIMNTTTTFLIKGIPRRPLYKELAHRLFQWNRHHQQHSQLTICDEDENMLLSLIPAEHFGFHEELDKLAVILSIPPPQHSNEISSWLNEVGDMGILRLLGMRQTIGSATDPCRPLMRLPASRTALLNAANQRHHPNSKLTVAARARSKHAHRSGGGQEESYFGAVKGTPESQNDTTHELLVKMLREAVWINIHTFGGRTGEDGPVLELRVKEGYGARWTADWSSCSFSTSTMLDGIQFRGFLEPQMEDGHEKKWRH